MRPRAVGDLGGSDPDRSLIGSHVVVEFPYAHGTPCSLCLLALGLCTLRT
jgi:hypothetical protein